MRAKRRIKKNVNFEIIRDTVTKRKILMLIRASKTSEL